MFLMNSFTNVQQTQKEKVVLVALQQQNQNPYEVEESLDELNQLSLTVHAEVVGKFIQKRERPDPKTYIGIGKAKEVATTAKELDAGTVIFNSNLTPSQQGNLEEIMDLKIIDRTALILDIFAQHAHSNEGKLQVELAQLNYMLPRLIGRGVELSRLGGGIGTRGPGETKLEVDRRRIKRRIQNLKRGLTELDEIRFLQRKQRKKSRVFGISLVGYTNAGKSTLLNKITSAGVLVQDKLFATLDSTSRKLILPSNREVVISDTVGFIRDLPHQLIASFKSTLDEIKEANLILHIIDASHPKMDEQIVVVEKTLEEIGASERLRLNIFNKVDKISRIQLERLKREFSDALFISALKNLGIDDLLEKIDEITSQDTVKVSLDIPYDKGEFVQMAYQLGRVVSEKHVSGGTILVTEIPKTHLSKFKRFFKKDAE